MAHRLWLLVEWVDERDIFPSYGVVNVGSLIGTETQLHDGKLIFVRDKHGNNTRRAQVLRISDNKKYVKDQKMFMERENHQVKNVLSSCVRQIAEMRSSQVYRGMMGPSQQYPAGSSSNTTMTMPQVVADSDDSSGSDTEAHYEIGRRHNTSAVPQNTHYNRETALNGRSGLAQTPGFPSRFLMSSTPVSEMNQFGSHTPVAPKSVNGSHTPKLTFDQGTQTDNIPTTDSTATIQFYTEQIDQMEIVIKELYRRFVSLVIHLNENGHGPLSLSMQPAIDNASTSDTTEPLESEPEHGTRSSPEQDVSNTTGEHSGANLNGSIKGESTPNARMLHVRRVSAHTTNTGEPNDGHDPHDNEMVPIGSGNTVVPSRLLNDIDWTSYSTATRQLLQAVFPRRVLATHSLTGKQSPAFMNKPPKQRLDPHVVNDIVDTVADRCGVSKRLVRCSITIKCTDESKLYRNRQQHRHARLEHHNQENVPPPPPSSDESTVTE